MPPGSSLFILTTALIAAVTEPTVGGAPARDAGADTTFVIRAGRLVDVREGRWI